MSEINDYTLRQLYKGEHQSNFVDGVNAMYERVLQLEETNNVLRNTLDNEQAQHPFNGLTPAAAERLALIIEECGEIVQACTKILRHGYACCYDNGETNRAALEREFGDLVCVMHMAICAGEIDENTILRYAEEKEQRIQRYTHHQEPRP